MSASLSDCLSLSPRRRRAVTTTKTRPSGWTDDDGTSTAGDGGGGGGGGGLPGGPGTSARLARRAYAIGRRPASRHAPSHCRVVVGVGVWLGRSATTTHWTFAPFHHSEMLRVVSAGNDALWRRMQSQLQLLHWFDLSWI